MDTPAFTQMRDKRRHNDEDDERGVCAKRTNFGTSPNCVGSKPDEEEYNVFSTKVFHIGKSTGRLDPNNVEHARRIQQRKRAIQFGKNTLGYTNFVKQVPKHRRKKFSMECPSTPDVYADIPTRRFQGQVKAWRKALHAYDPKDMLPDPGLNKESYETKTLANAVKTVQLKQIEDARKNGLQVDFNNSADDEHLKSSDQVSDRFDSLFARQGDKHDILTDSLEIDLDDVSCDSDDELL